MLYEEVTSLIGEVPAGFEPVIYICCIIVLLYILDCFYGVLRMLINHYLR